MQKRGKMNTNMNSTAIERKVLLSTIWLFAALNFLYCDVISLMDSNLLKQYLTGTVNGMEFSQGFLLAAAILVEIPIAMVLLARVLPYGVNRWTNIIAGLLMTLVQAASLFAGSPAMYYLFCSVLEIASTVMIVWFAWNWRMAGSLDQKVNQEYPAV
jgi:hypothetical protein